MVHTEQNPDGRAAAETRPLTRKQVAKMIASHPGSSLPRIFEAALSGSAARLSRNTLAVEAALDCCIALLKIEQGADQC
jgi:hypothetical protein